MIPSRKFPGEQLFLATHTICEVARGTEDRSGALSDLEAGFGEHDGALTALHQFCAKVAFQLADLHGERRLAYRTFFRRPTEMPMSGERIEIPELPKGQHDISLYL